MEYYIFFTLHKNEYEDEFNDVLFNDLHTYIRSRIKGIFRIQYEYFIPLLVVVNRFVLILTLRSAKHRKNIAKHIY